MKKVLAPAQNPGEPVSTTAPGIAFVYSGAGGKRHEIAEELYRTEPVFRLVLDRCDELLRKERGESLLDVMFSGGDNLERLDQLEWGNPSSFAVEIALTALWESIGIHPRAVLGQGIGEIAAAHTAGVLTLEDGLRLAAALTGPGAALPIVPVKAPALTLVSGATGRLIHDSGQLDNSHWRRLVTGGRAFEAGLQVLVETGAGLAVTLGSDMQFREAAETVQITILDGLQESHNDSSDGNDSFVGAVAAAYEAGAQVDFRGLFAGEERRRIAVPGYPFQRRSFWVQRRRAAP